MIVKQNTYLCVFYMIIDFNSNGHERTYPFYSIILILF